MVQIEIFEHRVIPRQRLFAREVAFDHRAAAALNGSRWASLTGDIANGITGQTSWRWLSRAFNLFQALADTR
jgi:hypothetical protein